MARTSNRAITVPQLFTLLSRLQRDELATARSRARSRAEDVEVPRHERPHYRFSNTYIQRLAALERLEDAVRRVCKHHDRHGRMSGDAAAVRLAIAFLEDTFHVSTVSRSRYEAEPAPMGLAAGNGPVARVRHGRRVG